MQQIAASSASIRLEVIRPQPGAGRRLSLPHGDRRAARFRRLSSARSTSRWPTAALDDLRARATQARAEGRLYGIGYRRRGRAQRLQHGLHHHRADAGGARARPGRRTARRRRRPSRSTRSAACPCTSPRCRRARATARCWRRSWPTRFGLGPGEHPRRHRAGHRARRLVDRLRQLFEPLRRGGRRRRRISPRRGCGDKLARIAARSSTCRPSRSCSPAARSRASGQSGQRVSFARARRHRALGARHAAGRDGPGAARDGVLDAAGADRAERRRRGQLLALPRLHLRLLRRRDRPRRPARCASTATSPCTTAAASCIRAWSRGRCAAASPMRSARRSTRNSPTATDGSFLAGTFADYLVPTATECRSR